MSRPFDEDAEDAVRLVAGMLRRGEGGEALRERRRGVSWSLSEAGLLSPAAFEERGTAVRLRRARESLLVARMGDGPDALRDAVREVARRGGGAPFLKPSRASAARPVKASRPAADDQDEEERFAALLAAAAARAVPDPRGVSLSLSVSWLSVARSVITPRAFLSCGATERLVATGRVLSGGSERAFAFQSSLPLEEAVAELGTAVHEALRPAPRLSPPEGEVDAVFSPGASAVFWHEAVGHPLEAEGAERESVLARVPGALVATGGLDVTDDPTRSDLPGGYLVDDEGVAARPVPLLTDGRVTEVLTDRRTAGAESNGHGRVPDFRRPPRVRLSNLVVTPGRATLEELHERCGNGVFVEEISAGFADPQSGRFRFLVESARAVRRGKLGASTGRFLLGGDVLQALHSLDASRGAESLPGRGLGLCVKGGDEVPVGGVAPAILVHGLAARPLPR